MEYLAIFLLIFGLAVLWWVRSQQRKAGLPGGRVIYADTRAWGESPEPLYDPIWGLTGKPDYLVAQGENLIPVEVKSSRIGQGPYDAHIFQLAAYCRLVHQVHGKRPPYGILHYPNRTYAIDYTPQLETALQGLLDEMRQRERHKEADRSHESPARCSACGYRSSCDQRLR